MDKIAQLLGNTILKLKMRSFYKHLLFSLKAKGINLTDLKQQPAFWPSPEYMADFLRKWSLQTDRHMWEYID